VVSGCEETHDERETSQNSGYDADADGSTKRPGRFVMESAPECQPDVTRRISKCQVSSSAYD
jgi:hypothetical protein